MAHEAKLGLIFVGILLTVFGALLLKKLSKHGNLPPMSLNASSVKSGDGGSTLSRAAAAKSADACETAEREYQTAGIRGRSSRDAEGKRRDHLELDEDTREYRADQPRFQTNRNRAAVAVVGTDFGRRSGRSL